jgi:hypothetical protein
LARTFHWQSRWHYIACLAAALPAPPPHRLPDSGSSGNTHNRMALILRDSSIHASGCYTTAPIKKKSFIVEYTGPRISKRQADALYETARRTYLFGLEDGKQIIDGTGIAAFINHSCDPNCETDEVDGRIWIIALRDIDPGEELAYDYNLYDGDEDDEAVCRCGARSCRGAMYSEDEITKRAKSAAKSAAKKTSRKANSSARHPKSPKSRAPKKPLSARLTDFKRRAQAARRAARRRFQQAPFDPEPFRPVR